MIVKIGKMLGTLREETGISQKDLARGIFTLTDYSRIERGERETDKMHLEALFQRLGKSGDKLEFAIPIGEYYQIYYRYSTLQALAVGNIKDAEKYIKSYADNLDMEKPLHLQSLLFLKAVKSYVKEKNVQKTLSRLKETLEITFPDWKNADYDNICLCRQEIQLLLLIGYLNILIAAENGNKEKQIYAERDNPEEILEKLLKYLNEKYADTEEQAKVLPKCLWLLGIIYKQQDNIGKALKVCERGIEILSVNGVLASMKELLSLKAECLKKIGDDERYGKCYRQIEAIEFLYQMADIKYPTEEIITLLLTSIQEEITVTNELIKELREAKGISQEELCEGICTRETLSRIESGKRNPNKRNFFAMLKKMGVERETYYGYIVADDYYLYEKVRTYFMSEGKTQEVLENAEKTFEKLEKNLDKRYLTNRQFLETMRIEKKNKDTQSDWKQSIKEMKQILNYSMEGYEGKIYRVPFRQEVIILVYIAISLRRLDKKEEALEIYRQILEKYEKSMVEKPFHAVPLFLVYVNYVGLLEVSDYLEKSEKIAKEGIAFSLECQRGDIAAEILANISCVYEKKVDTELARLCLKNSFYLLELYQYERECIVLKESYEKVYKMKLN